MRWFSFNREAGRTGGGRRKDVLVDGPEVDLAGADGTEDFFNINELPSNDLKCQSLGNVKEM
jgi:hypothetical protein